MLGDVGEPSLEPRVALAATERTVATTRSSGLSVGEPELEPEPEPQPEPELEPVQSERVLTEAEATELVRKAVALYQTKYRERYGVEEVAVRKALDPVALHGASRPVGVYLHFLKAMQCTLGNDKLRTEDVAAILTKATAESELSVVEAFMPGCMVQHTHFVSHGWRELFSGLVSALEDFHKRTVRITTIKSNQSTGSAVTIFSDKAEVDDSDKDPARVPYFWLDIFAKNQHTVNSKHTEQELKEMVATASVFAPVFEQWPTPGVLSRSWCLFEFYHAIKLGKPFEPAVVASASNAIDAGFLKTDGKEEVVSEHSFSIDTWEVWTPSHDQLLLIENVDLSTAEARFPEDKERIDHSVSEDIGFDEMNRLVREALIANLYTARAVARKHATFQSVYM
eukprot:COSAG02_NODE_6809_length_3349_cov_7.200000_1_plen_396_part_00